MAEALHFEVYRDDLRRTRFAAASPLEPAPGEAILRIDRCALTANNITYAVAGDRMSYWKFFPAESGWGRVPVWGFADVERSTLPELREGERVYGYFPMSTHLAVRPDAVTPSGFVDAAAHRAALPPVYNQYRRLAGDPRHDPSLEDRQAVLQPLFMTGWLLADLLADEQFSGARRVVIASASSKTAIGLAAVLARAGGAEVVGLTSRANSAFVEKLGCYARVVPYEEIASLPAAEPVVFVDMAGDAAVQSAVHRHFGDRLVRSIGVGLTHWESGPRAADLPGAKPEIFFAPTRIQKRSQEWGARALQQRMGEAWREFASDSARWLDIRQCSGRAALERAYLDTLEGRTRPHEGLMLSFRS